MKIIHKVQHSIKAYNTEKFMWLLIGAYFVLAYIADYTQTQYNKYIIGASLVGLLYCYLSGTFRKENKKMILVITMVTGMIACYWCIKKVIYPEYVYYNYTIGAFLIIYANLYATKIKQLLREKCLPRCHVVSVLTILFLISTQITLHVDKKGYLLVLIAAIPIVFTKRSKEQVQISLVGMIDGILVGFLLTQVYAWGFRHYYYEYERYRGYTDYCTFMGMQYMLFYIASITKYAIYKATGDRKYKQIITWWMSAFILSLMYLTGGRSPILGSITATVILFFVLFMKKFSFKSLGVVAIRGLLIGFVSLALFPVAYASVRYLPTIIGRVDYVDNDSNRRYSFSTVVLNQTYYWTGEYSDFAIKTADSWDSMKYITLKESLYETLGRIVPGATTVFNRIGLSEQVYVQQIERMQYYYEQGIISEESLGAYLEYYQGKFADIVVHDLEVTIVPSLLLATTGDVSYTVDSETEVITDKRGTSLNNPWFPEGYEYTSMELRNAIHAYAISELTFVGHERNTFLMYADEEFLYGHAHNIFLLVGYDFGISAMMILMLLFVAVIFCGYKEFVAKGRYELLFPLLLVVGMIVYGWWEVGFGIDHSITFLILLACVQLKENME
ncbi:MAG: hypothetical protein R3Y47_02785 [Lachnospiraceae bacterium]